MKPPRKQVSRILAVGNAPDDGIRRLTRGDHFVCCAGDEREHRDLTAFCRDLQALLEAGDLHLSDFSPSELRQWIAGFLEDVPRA